MSTTIKIKCIDQTLTYESTPTVASGGKKEDYVEFEFCSKWDGFTDKTAVFYRNKEKVYYSLIDESNTCVIPYEVLTTEGTIYFGVFGVKGDVTRTSEILSFKIVKGAITDGLLPSEPTQDIYEQILSEVTSARNLANSTYEAEKAFEKAITKQQNDYETNVTNQWTTYKNNLTKQQDDYETSMNTAWGKYKTDLTKQQNDYETDLSNQWTTYKTDLTNQQTTFETNTTEKLNTYESNVESIAEESTNNAINKALQDKTITLSTSWNYDSTNGYYTQDVAVVGMKATDKPVLDVVTDGNATNIVASRKEWSKIIQADTFDGGIKFYAKSATTKELTVVIKPELSKVTINNVSSAEAGLDALQSQVNTNTSNIADIESGETKLPEWQVYSTEETAIGTWIDGKTIYRKVYVLDNQTTQTLNIDVSDLQIDDVLVLSGVHKNISGSETPEDQFIPYYSDSQNWLRLYLSLGKTIRMHGTTYPSRPFKATIIIEYTKK